MKHFAFIVAVVAILCSVVFATPHVYPRIQYDVNFMQAAFLFNDKNMFTFAPNDLVGDVVTNDEIMSTYFGGKQCHFFDLHEKQLIPLTTTLFDAIIHHDPILHCGNVHVKGQYDIIQLESIHDWKNDIKEEHVRLLREQTKEGLLNKPNGRDVAPGTKVTPTREYPWYKRDIMSASVDTLLGWATEFIKYHWPENGIHKFPVYKSCYNNILKTDPKAAAQYVVADNTENNVGIYHMGTGKPLTIEQSRALAQQKGSSNVETDITTFGMTGDWGAGTLESQVVADLLAQGVDHTINLGDLYPVGSPVDATSKVLGIREETDIFEKGVTWRKGAKGSWYITGNHEMYAAGYGLFDLILPTLGPKENGKFVGQPTTYFVLENAQWRLVFLDTGYTTYSELIHNDTNPQLPVVVNWLENTVKLGDANDKRGVIIFTHHNFVSAFKDSYSATSVQLKQLLKNRTVLNFWGHEHKTAIYEKSNLGNITSYPRCVGTGGFNVDQVDIPPTTRTSGLIAFDNRFYDVIPGDFWNSTAGFNGYTKMNFTGDTLTVDYWTIQWKDSKKTVLDRTAGHKTMTETFKANLKTGDIEQLNFQILDKDITTIKNIEISGPKSAPNLHSQTHIESYGYSMDKYYEVMKDTRFTRLINPTPKYSEEAQKDELKEYIVKHILPHRTKEAINRLNAECEIGKNMPLTEPKIDYDTIINQNGHQFYGVRFD